MRAGAFLLVALLLPLAGCAAPSDAPPVGTDPPPEGPPIPWLVAIDGHHTFDAAGAATFFGLADPGALLAVSGRARLADGRMLAVDALALDARARALAGGEAGVAPPAPGGVIVTDAYAARHGLRVGDDVTLLVETWPEPLAPTYHEMERVRHCPSAAPICLANKPGEDPVLQLDVPVGAQDLAFLPDLVEIRPGGLPAYWNGTFRSPDGEVRPFTAHALREGTLRAAEWDGPAAPGRWTIPFTVESNGSRVPGGIVGIVRVREPNHLWYDDRLQHVDDPAAQARAVLANATPRERAFTVAQIAPDEGAWRLLGADLHLHPEDLRALLDAPPGAASGLLVLAPSSLPTTLGERQRDGASGALLALRARPLPLEARPLAAQGAFALFRAPADVDVATLPNVEGAGRPTVTLAVHPGLGDRVALATRDHTALRVLAHADTGAPSWTMPPGGKWENATAALEGLRQARAVGLASRDLVDAPVVAVRTQVGDGLAHRAFVLVGAVEGGPPATLWVGAALAASLGEPLGARVLVPIADEAARMRLAAAYAPHGLAPEP